MLVTLNYQMYKKRLIKRDYIKVIKNPSDDEIKIKESGAIEFKINHVPTYLVFNY